MRPLFSFSTFILLLVSVSITFAQDTNSKGFYDKNFSNSPLGGDGAAIPGTKKKAEKSPTPPLISTPLTTPSPEIDNRKRVKVDSIGVLLNSMKQEHTEARIKELLTVAHDFDFGIGSVFFVGGFPGGGAFAAATAIVGRGGEIRVVGHVPYRYKVSQSPTWILKTDEGEVLLEGTGPLKQNFDKDGKFIYPETSEEATAVDATPTPVDVAAIVKDAVKAAKSGASAEPSPEPLEPEK